MYSEQSFFNFTVLDSSGEFGLCCPKFRTVFTENGFEYSEYNFLSTKLNALSFEEDDQVLLNKGNAQIKIA